MAATNASKPQTAVVDKLRSADQRWARRNNDQAAAPEYLEHLACSLGNLTAPSTSKPDPAADDGTDQLRARITELESAATANTKLIGELRADYAAAANDTKTVTIQLEKMTAERDILAQQLTAIAEHRCAWPWTGPDERAGICVPPAGEAPEVSGG